MKKVFKILGAVLLLFIILLFTLPILFKGKIFDMVMEEANKNLKAEVSIADLNLSLIENFPKFTITISGIKVIGQEPFAGVPLADIGEACIFFSKLPFDTGKDRQCEGSIDFGGYPIIFTDHEMWFYDDE